ncbi:MAG: hypothetical protein IT392_07700 [Nitrospirae bacterium]|nr:hypothetical protein [Nitrospirota bacterium]
MKKNLIVLFLLSLFCIVLSTDSFAESPSQELFTSYNLWFEKPDSLWSINYQKGEIIPAGTKINSVNLKRNKVVFTTSDNSTEYVINFTPKYHPGITLEQFRDRLFTNKTFDQLVRGFSKKEIEGIRSGQIVPGMSKKAVLVAYGYPPEHVTGSLDMNLWTYWSNRFKKTAVNFDKSGHTTGN